MSPGGCSGICSTSGIFCHSYWKIPRYLPSPGMVLIGGCWRRAEFKDKQCISKELLKVIAHADSVEGASMRGTALEDITPSPFFES